MKRSRIVLPRGEYKALCNEVFERDGWKCRVRGCNKREDLHPHHVKFRSHGGDDTESNLITLCGHCHSALHERYLTIMPSNALEDIDASKPVRWHFLAGWRPGRPMKIGGKRVSEKLNNN